MIKIKTMVALVAMLTVMVVGAAPAFAQIGPNFDDQNLRSGDVDTETNISIEGNNNNQCNGVSQSHNTGNYANQQGVLQDGPFIADDVELEGGDFVFAPENETGCEQAVQQSSAASS